MQAAVLRLVRRAGLCPPGRLATNPGRAVFGEAAFAAVWAAGRALSLEQAIAEAFPDEK